MLTLYHGTAKRHLKKILHQGLKPRGKGTSNWQGFGESRPDLVYLTDCYAAFYASMACKKKGDQAVVLKLSIDPAKIRLYADEEFLFNLLKGSVKMSTREDAIRIYNNLNPKNIPLSAKGLTWVESLRFMGTVSCDAVPPNAIVGYALESDALDFISHCDPSISPMNYRILGEKYRQHLESLKYKEPKQHDSQRSNQRVVREN